MRIRSVLSHSVQAVAEGALIALLVVGLMAGSVFAAKGGGKGHGGTTGGGGGTLVLVLVNSPDTVANWGESVTYAVSTTATIYPYVSTQCVQNGVLVLSDSAGYYDSYAWPAAKVFVLATPVWSSGAADCTARLYSMDSGSQSILATITYHVAA